MSGFPITSMVRFVTVFAPLDDRHRSALCPQESGKSLMDANELEPLVTTDSAGVQTSWLTSGLLTLKFFALFLVSLQSVPLLSMPEPMSLRRIPSSSAFLRHQWALLIQFIKKIKAEKGYERIGSRVIYFVALTRWPGGSHRVASG